VDRGRRHHVPAVPAHVDPGQNPDPIRNFAAGVLEVQVAALPRPGRRGPRDAQLREGGLPLGAVGVHYYQAGERARDDSDVRRGTIRKPLFQLGVGGATLLELGPLDARPLVTRAEGDYGPAERRHVDPCGAGDVGGDGAVHTRRQTNVQASQVRPRRQGTRRQPPAASGA